jgi:transcriptional regulator with PAS, ATPase and Fis domain
LQYNRNRQDKPIVVQNCSAFNENLLESELFGHMRGSFTGAVRDKEGLFEVADGGTFFLDELGEMSQALQVKLLRVLQDGSFMPVGGTKLKKVDVRIIAATNRNLKEMLKQGTFREDLYYRLNVVNIRLPALRERPSDIPKLVEHFLNKISLKHKTAPKTLSSAALSALSDYAWPGNIRELENELERLVLMAAEAGEIGVELVSSHIKQDQSSSAGAAAAGSLKEALEELERYMIVSTLKRLNGNKSEAARVLGVSRSNLIAKVQSYGIEPGSE